MNWFLYIGAYVLGTFANMVVIRQFLDDDKKSSKNQDILLDAIIFLGAFIYVWLCWKFVV